MFLELRECKARSNSVSEGAKDHKYSLFNTGGLLRRTEKMEAILMKAASFIAVIILGYGLRKAGFFKEEDFYVLSKIVLKITLPASIIANFSQAEIQPAMLLLCLVGFAGGVLYMSLGWILGGKDRDEKAFHILNMPLENVKELSASILEAKENVRYCKECFTLTDQEVCPICSNPKRNKQQIMVVENTRDLAAYEKTGKYEGVYHVLHGAISPMLGIGPNDIRLKELMQRLQNHVEEVIIATNSSLEGETTAMYISKLIKPTGIKVSRIASGVPVGGDLEYIDEVTLLRALEGRVLL